MKNILHINAHQPYPFSQGSLNKSLSERAISILREKEYVVRKTISAEQYDIQEELEKHSWAHYIILQTPVNWMGVPWSFKKYMDEVYSAGMGGDLCNGDGRKAENPKKNYGAGGILRTTKYMLSLTFNAPLEAFNDQNEFLFQGKSVDELFYPMHMNFRFFGMQALETFACYDVMKNPQIDQDLKRFKNHLNKYF
ncbi:MAG: NAD(P)H-dependent oxidoreductase [Pseudomonadota bacterium]